MIKSRSKNDAYFSYRWRCQKAGKPFMSIEDFWKSRKTGEKKQDGSFKPDWNKPNKRLPLMWMEKYNSIKKLKDHKKLVILRRSNNPTRYKQYTDQISKIDLVLNLINEINV